MRLTQLHHTSFSPRQVYQIFSQPQDPTSQIDFIVQEPGLPPPTTPQVHPHDPPYRPTTAGRCGFPTMHLDVPFFTAGLLTLFVLGAIGNMTLFQLDNRCGHNLVIPAPIRILHGPHKHKRLRDAHILGNACQRTLV